MDMWKIQCIGNVSVDTRVLSFSYIDFFFFIGVLFFFLRGKQGNTSTSQETGDTHSDDNNNSQQVSLSHPISKPYNKKKYLFERDT